MSLGYPSAMLQIIFSGISAKELTAMPRQLQIELLDGFQVLPADFEKADEKFGLLTRGGKKIYRYRVKDYRIYFEKRDGIINVLCILNRNSLKDFFFGSLLRKKRSFSEFLIRMHSTLMMPSRFSK